MQSSPTKNRCAKQCWEREKSHIFNSANKKQKIVKINSQSELENVKELTGIIPGMQHVLSSEKNVFRKLFWSMVIGVSFLICTSQIFIMLKTFLSSPIETQVILMHNDTVKFPSLTICPDVNSHVELAALKKQIAGSTNASVYCSVHIFQLFPRLNVTAIWKMMSMFGLLNSAYGFARSAYSAKIVTPLDSKNIKTIYGTCTTFFLKNPVPFRGEDYFMQVVFNPYECGKFAAQYMLHQDNEDVTYKFTTSYNQVPKKKVMHYGLRARRISYLKRTELPCAPTISEVDQCERKCLDNILSKQNISCSLPYMSLEGIPPCKTYSSASAAHILAYRSATTISYSRDCSCPRACDQTQYFSHLKIITTSVLPTLAFLIVDNTIEHIIEQYSYSFIEFLCDVGGTLGLFLGLCVPGIIELFQSLFFLSFKTIVRKK